MQLKTKNIDLEELQCTTTNLSGKLQYNMDTINTISSKLRIVEESNRSLNSEIVTLQQ